MSLRRPGIGAVGHATARARRVDDRRGLDAASVLERDGLATLEASVERPGRDAELARVLEAEPARFRALLYGVSERKDPVVEPACLDRDVGRLQHLPLLDLGDAKREDRLEERRARNVAQEPRDPWRAEDVDVAVVTREVERAEQPRKPEHVIAVQVGDEDVAQAAEPQVGAQQLVLRALAAVEQRPFALARERARRHVPTRRRPTGAGAQYDPFHRGIIAGSDR
jgi:hypothetical protein